MLLLRKNSDSSCLPAKYQTKPVQAGLPVFCSTALQLELLTTSPSLNHSVALTRVRPEDTLALNQRLPKSRSKDHLDTF